MVTMCNHGHPYNQENTYIDPKGKRHCRTCSRERTKSWHHRVNKVRLAKELEENRASYKPPPQLVPTYDARFGAWLTGFTDGEGSFIAGINAAGGLGLNFTIKLRKDDRPVLEMIRDTLAAGHIHDGVPSLDCKLRANPSSTWAIKRVLDLYQKVLPHFDLYPLNSKKKRDYEIWREIVIIVAGRYPTSKSTIVDDLGSKLGPMIARLKKVREYRSSR